MFDWLNAGVRFVLNVSFHEKERAKQMGCRWIDKQWCYDYDVKKECINFEDLIGFKWVSDIEAIHFFEIRKWLPYGAIELSEKDTCDMNTILSKIQKDKNEYRAKYDDMKRNQQEALQSKIRDEYYVEECNRLCKEQGITGKKAKAHFLHQYKMERNLHRRIWEIVGDPDDDEGFEKELQRFIDYEIKKFENP